MIMQVSCLAPTKYNGIKKGSRHPSSSFLHNNQMNNTQQALMKGKSNRFGAFKYDEHAVGVFDNKKDGNS